MNYFLSFIFLSLINSATVNDSINFIGQLNLESIDAKSYVLKPEEIQQLEKQAQQLYEKGNFLEAIILLEKVIQVYQNQGDILNQLFALRNLALIYTKLGNFDKAQSIINQVITKTHEIENSTKKKQLLAQSLEVKGQIEFLTGQTEQALETWQNSSQIYQELKNINKFIQSRINEVQALQALGLYYQATKTINTIIENLELEPDSLVKARALHTLGDVLRQVGQLEESDLALQKSLSIAEAFNANKLIPTIFLSLANTAKFKQDYSSALTWYQKILNTSSSELKLLAKINIFNLLIEQNKWSEASILIPEIEKELLLLPPNRTVVYSRINFAISLRKIPNAEKDKFQSLEVNQLAKAIQEAKNLGDKRAESYGLGHLGNVYEKQQRWDEAMKLTENALLLAQAMNAGDLAYQWQWQLGRIIKSEGETQGNINESLPKAIAAYSQSVKTLSTLRRDLLSANSTIQFEFRESVEPVYRELVDLLLKQSINNPDNLLQARETIESLQLAELENYFREICLVATQSIDRVVDVTDRKAAIVYPIVLKDRVEIILKLPQQPLQRYTTYIPQDDVENIVSKLRENLTKPYTFKETQSLSMQLYAWLLQPMEEILQQSQVKTLVFVLDSALRNIPMAVLYDGQQYLIQKYNIALAPGLQLIDPQPLKRKQLQVLAAGLSEARHGFAPLNFVKTEIKAVNALASGKIMLNQEFTEENLNQTLIKSSYPVVHLATHGQFSSKAEDTFILAWDRPIGVKNFNQLLRSREINKDKAIELLILSACQTAVGDKQAALGIAGVALRSGARSVLASLWNLDDESTAIFMENFYQKLIETNVTKTEALRSAQLSLLKNPRYEHPRYWASYVLVGNWL